MKAGKGCLMGAAWKSTCMLDILKIFLMPFVAVGIIFLVSGIVKLAECLFSVQEREDAFGDGEWIGFLILELSSLIVVGLFFLLVWLT
jgi:hypothetical protein